MGIDLGGSGFRIGVFDTSTGELLRPLYHENHTASTGPADVLPALVSAIEDLGWSGPIGLGFPGAVDGTRPTTAPNLGPAWVGKDVGAALRQFHGGAFVMLNDADAVAVAEAEHGVGHDEHDCVLTLTVGTGLGTTVHRQGTMIPNLEYGRLPSSSAKGMLGRTPLRCITNPPRLGPQDLGFALPRGPDLSGGNGSARAHCSVRRYHGALVEHSTSALHRS